MQFVAPISWSDALDYIGDKSPIGAALSSSEWSDVPVALRQRAMFSANVENVRFLDRAQGALGDFLAANKELTPDGETVLKTGGRAAFIDQMREFAQREGMGVIDPEEKGTIKDIRSERRLGLIFNTLTTQAGSYAYYKQGQDPDVLNEFPASRFIRVVDVKEPRLNHQLYQGNVYLKNDPIWATRINQDFGVPWAPFGWGCGHDVEDVDREEAVALGLIGDDERVEPDVKHFNENLQASTHGLAPELVEKLKTEFGSRLLIGDDGMMSWNPAPDVQPAAAISSPTPAAAPSAPAQPSAMRVNQKPVSDGLDIRVRGELKKQVQIALDAINKVHDDGELPVIPLRSSTPENAVGVLRSRNGYPTEMGVAKDGPWPSLTTAHEVGHFLDASAIGPKGSFATKSGDPIMDDFMSAALKTEAIKGLQAQLAKAGTDWEQVFYDTMLKPHEIWARAYAQFIAERSGDPTLKRELQRVIDANKNRQWSTEDFAAVAAEIEKLFKQLGWI